VFQGNKPTEYTHKHTHTHFTDPIFIKRQLNMKQVNIIIRQNTHTHTHRQWTQQKYTTEK